MTAKAVRTRMAIRKGPEPSVSFLGTDGSKQRRALEQTAPSDPATDLGASSQSRPTGGRPKLERRASLAKGNCPFSRPNELHIHSAPRRSVDQAPAVTRSRGVVSEEHVSRSEDESLPVARRELEPP